MSSINRNPLLLSIKYGEAQATVELVCKHCGLHQNLSTTKIIKHYLPNGGYHLKALCPGCERFIKNVPYSLPKVLHFGKYKGKPIAVIAKENPAYLRWLYGRDIKDSLRKSIKLELEKIENTNTQEYLTGVLDGK